MFQPYPFAQTAAHRLTLPHLLPPDIIQIRKPKSIHEIILPSKPNFQSDLGGFHCCRWSPIGFSRSNGCILATLSLGNQVSFFQEVKQAGIKNWAMTHHFGSSKEENVRVQSKRTEN